MLSVRRYGACRIMAVPIPGSGTSLQPSNSQYAIRNTQYAIGSARNLLAIRPVRANSSVILTKVRTQDTKRDAQRLWVLTFVRMTDNEAP